LGLVFPRSARLRKRPEFLKVQEEGKRHAGSHIILLAIRRGSGPTRMGVTVSRRLGGAVARNRVKRHLREAFRLNRPGFREGFDLVVVARGSAVKVSFQRLEEDLLRLAGAAGVLAGADGKPRRRPGEELPARPEGAS